MYEVTDGSGNTFVFQNFEEIEEFFNEVIWAVGAEDAQISVKFANPSNDWGELIPVKSTSYGGRRKCLPLILHYCKILLLWTK